MTGHTVVVLIIGVSIAIRIAIIMIIIIIFYDYPQFYIYLNDVRKSCYLLSWTGDRRNKDKEDFTYSTIPNKWVISVLESTMSAKLFRQIVRQKNVVFYCQLSHSVNFYGLKEPSIV